MKYNHKRMFLSKNIFRQHSYKYGYPIQMSFSIDQKLLKNILDSIKDVASKNKNNIQEIRLSAEKEGLCVTTSDAECSLIVDIFLHSDIFNEYNINEYSYIDLNVDNLRKLMSSADNIIITFNKVNKADEICVTFGKKIRSSYNLKAIDTDKEDFQIDTYNYDIQLTLDAALFKQMISRLSGHSDTCKISCTEEGLIFKIDSNTVRAVEIIEIDEENEENMKLKEVKINVDKLSSVLKTNVLSDKIVLQICGDIDIPIAICISYIKDSSHMKYYFSKMDDAR